MSSRKDGRLERLRRNKWYKRRIMQWEMHWLGREYRHHSLRRSYLLTCACERGIDLNQWSCTDTLTSRSESVQSNVPLSSFFLVVWKVTARAMATFRTIPTNSELSGHRLHHSVRWRLSYIGAIVVLHHGAVVVGHGHCSCIAMHTWRSTVVRKIAK